jgi:hypothetical protein
MATTAVYLDRSLSSVYLLWYLLKNTADDIVAYQFNLPRRMLASRFAIAPSPADSTKIDSIAQSLQSVRSFTYEKLDISTYDPKWTSIHEFELIHQASITSMINNVALPYTVEMKDFPSTQMLKANAAVFNKEKRAGLSMVYPLVTASKGLIDATIETPADVLVNVLDTVKEISISKRKKLLESGMTRSEIFAAESLIYDGTHSRYGVDSDGTWFVDGDSLFGIVVGRKSFLADYPYYSYLTK